MSNIKVTGIPPMSSTSAGENQTGGESRGDPNPWDELDNWKKLVSQLEAIIDRFPESLRDSSQRYKELSAELEQVRDVIASWPGGRSSSEEDKVFLYTKVELELANPPSPKLADIAADLDYVETHDPDDSDLIERLREDLKWAESPGCNAPPEDLDEDLEDAEQDRVSFSAICLRRNNGLRKLSSLI